MFMGAWHLGLLSAKINKKLLCRLIKAQTSGEVIW